MLYDAPCMQGRLQVLDDGTLRVQAAFGRTAWQVSQPLLTGITTQPGAMGSLNVTFHTQTGTYEAKMVTQANFAKLQPYFSPPQQMAQGQQTPYAPYGGPPSPQQPIQQQPGPYAPYGQPLAAPPPMPPAPPPTAKKQSHKRTWIVVSIIAALLVLVGVISNIGNGSPSQNSSSSIATPDPLAGARFGGQFAAFTAKYGQPESVISNLAFIQNLQVSNDQGHVDNMLAGVPKGQTWTVSAGESQCKAFYPADAVHVRDFPTADVDKLNDGIAMVYTSAALARVFPAGRFIDQQHHPVAAGTFTVAYSYTFSKSTNQWDKAHLLQCELDLGIPDYLKAYTG